MTHGSKAKELDARLESIEEMLNEIVGRIGLLDEQARRAGYQVQLALRYCDVEHAGKAGTAGPAEERQDEVANIGALAAQADRRIERLRARL